MNSLWTSGNRISLLECGEAHFPRIFDAIAGARDEVIIETFILYDDKVGRALHAALSAAAGRGVRVDLTVDGFGSSDLSTEFIGSLAQAGVRVHVFDPAPRPFRRLNYFRRMHRKLAMVDGTRAFIGGINYSAEHLADFGPKSKHDYSVEVEGPVVSLMRRFMHERLPGHGQAKHAFGRSSLRLDERSEVPADGAAAFVWRDNGDHRNDIERQYRLKIRLARRRVIIANAYFFPGYTFLRELRKAARRGVEVSLILQGNPDMPFVRTAASMLYHFLLQGGVGIYEYCERPLHCKVALIDDEWATVGSSNLDPLSLSLNLEANLFIRDRGFSEALGRSLRRMMKNCRKIEAADLHESSFWRQLRSFFLFHFLRHYPEWAGWLPAHAPRLKSIPPSDKIEAMDHLNKTA